MKRLFVALLLFASVSLATAADITLRVVGDARQPFQTMLNANKLRNGMNLILTDPTGVKIWANLKKEGKFSRVDWVMTDMAGKTLESFLVKIEYASPRSQEGKCWDCKKSPDGPAGPPNCTEVPCPIHIPCCQDPLHPLQCCVK
jgi:hypothetical protein